MLTTAQTLGYVGLNAIPNVVKLRAEIYALSGCTVFHSSEPMGIEHDHFAAWVAAEEVMVWWRCDPVPELFEVVGGSLFHFARRGSRPTPENCKSSTRFKQMRHSRGPVRTFNKNVPKVRFVLPETLEGVLIVNKAECLKRHYADNLRRSQVQKPHAVGKRVLQSPKMKKKIVGMETGHALARILHVCMFNEHAHADVASSMCASSMHPTHPMRAIEHVCKFKERYHTISGVASSMCASSRNAITPSVA